MRAVQCICLKIDIICFGSRNKSGLGSWPQDFTSSNLHWNSIKYYHHTWCIVPRGKYNKSPGSKTTSSIGSPITSSVKLSRIMTKKIRKNYKSSVHYDWSFTCHTRAQWKDKNLPLENRASTSLSVRGLYNLQCFLPSSWSMKASMSS